MITWLLLTALGATLATTSVDHEGSDAFASWLARHQAEVEHAAVWRSPTGPRRSDLITGMQLLAMALEACDERVEHAARHLEPAGLQVTRHRVGPETFILLTELQPDGTGWSAWRCGPARDLVLQAPHAMHDLDTDLVVRLAFVRGTARGAMWSTVHRYRAEPDEHPADEVHPADVTRQPASLFQSTSLAIASVRRELRFIQVHGFAASERDPDVIVSTARRARPAGPAADVLATHLPARRVATWAVDTNLLGATDNVLLRALSGSREPRVLHLELSREVRRQWAADPAGLTQALEGLADIGWAR